jgi:ATP adenylyltransferase
MKGTSKGYNFETARYKEQLQQMKDLSKRGICAFCYENIRTEQREPIELETQNWVIKKNDYPYEGTKLHLMLIPKEHVKTFADLSQAAQKDFSKTITEVEKHFKLTSYALGMRSGDFRYNGGSVEHIHAHIVVGDTEDPLHEPVRFKMTSRPKS